MSSESTVDEAKHARAVRDMFGGIAGKYDFLNHFLSVNIDKRWRRLVKRGLHDVLADEDALVLDVACGTGDLSIELKRESRAAVFGTDFCRPMLTIAKRKTDAGPCLVPFVEADGMNLAFPTDTFDALTIAFGLRNFSNWTRGLQELHRVLKPGGRISILEFSSPVVPGFREIFRFYFSSILPLIGGAVSGSRGAYEYLPNSVNRFPDQDGLIRLMIKTGFRDTAYKNLTGGIAAIHTGTKIIA
jgi:demethylmenaquinone methyltransferase / 2-methoxy-6-polyprenyl-1,4-benzoquinol methylase